MFLMFYINIFHNIINVFTAQRAEKDMCNVHLNIISPKKNVEKISSHQKKNVEKKCASKFHLTKATLNGINLQCSAQCIGK